MTEAAKPKSKRGLASMSLERRKAIASLGGKSVPSEKRMFALDPIWAAEAGRKGGIESNIRRRTAQQKAVSEAKLNTDALNSSDRSNQQAT